MTQDRLKLRALSPNLGVEVLACDLSKIDDRLFDQIAEAWYAHSVLLFRNQHLDDAALIAFSRCLGALDLPPLNENGNTYVAEHPEIYVVSNVIGPDGIPIGSLGAGEAQWHTDMSYVPEPPDASMLYALEVPAAGGDTWFCNMEAAWRDLPEDLKRSVASRSIKHDATYNSGGYLRKGLSATDDPTRSVGAMHPMVCAHPVTQRPALYLGRRRNAYIAGLSLPDSESLLDEVWRHVARSEHCLSHRWRVGDLLLWDNRNTMHRRNSFDAADRRVMHRTQIKGTSVPRAYLGDATFAL